MRSKLTVITVLLVASCRGGNGSGVRTDAPRRAARVAYVCGPAAGPAGQPDGGLLGRPTALGLVGQPPRAAQLRASAGPLPGWARARRTGRHAAVSRRPRQAAGRDVLCRSLSERRPRCIRGWVEHGERVWVIAGACGLSRSGVDARARSLGRARCGDRRAGVARSNGSRLGAVHAPAVELSHRLRR